MLALHDALAKLATLDPDQARLVELHCYELPEVVVLPVADGGSAYLEWVRNETSD